MDWLLLGLIIFVFLNLVDLTLTNSILKFGGKEFNPFVRFLYSKSGLIGVGTFKLIILTLFTLQYIANTLDMYTIWYFDFSYAVILSIMYFDIRKAKAPIFPNSEHAEVKHR